LQDAERAFVTETGANPVVPPDLALQSAFCEMASLDENRRYYRAFRTSAEIAEYRFPVDDHKLVDALEKSLRHFGQRGLLTEGRSGWDVTHEALIRNWMRLSRWVRDDVARDRAMGEVLTKTRITTEQALILRPVLGVPMLGWGKQPIYPPAWQGRAASA